MAPPADPPAWVLLRGLVRESRHWGDFPRRLVTTYPGCAVHCPDLPGNGLRNAEPSPWRIEDMMEDCRSGLRAAGAAPPYRLLALSLGGMIATAWAARYPSELAALVLVNTSMRPFSPFYRRLRPASYAALLRSVMAADRRDRESAILGLVSNDPARRAGTLAHWAALARDRPVSAGNALRQLVAAARFRASREVPEAPTLVLASLRDRLVDVSCSRTLAHAWGAHLAAHPQAGHDLPLDDPDWVIAEVTRRFAPTPTESPPPS
jgi:pimeloyl-ACP methyl ester carboxylesterase